MATEISYKKEHSFEKRKEEATKMREKYPDKIPIIVDLSPKWPFEGLDKKKYLVPHELTLGKFMSILRSRIKLPPGEALFLFINNTILPLGNALSNIYDTQKDKDGFLYVVLSVHETFG